jgi:hypothetical protein
VICLAILVGEVVDAAEGRPGRISWNIFGGRRVSAVVCLDVLCWITQTQEIMLNIQRMDDDNTVLFSITKKNFDGGVFLKTRAEYLSMAPKFAG